ncbi:hypothetical protein J1N35_042847 [Gossypium stocksii]|uniref:Uncharacterized protein n=1 Tax=Gossypium stocksii TaxID=47602 RepID=A0A9D3U6B1_9ROSI|nr:hypothetical protein J1N35_042847 [Gossypium stocksii]
MAVNFVMRSCLVQPKPSLSLKTLQNPSLPQLSRLFSPSRVGFLLTKTSGVVGKLSAPSAVPHSAYSRETVFYVYGARNWSKIFPRQGQAQAMRNQLLGNRVKSCFQCWESSLLQSCLCPFKHLKVCRNDELTVEELKRIFLHYLNIYSKEATSIVVYVHHEAGLLAGKTVRSPYGLKLGDSCCVYYYDEKEAGLFTGLPNFANHPAAFRPRFSYEITNERPIPSWQGPDAFLDMDGFPLEALKVTAFTEDGLIMAARHKIYKYLHGVHFSQQSIITSEGKIIVQNFIKLKERKEAAESQN